MNIIEVKNLRKNIGENLILKDINFSLKPNERLAIVGGNGAGKTTLLNIITGIDKKYSGEVITSIKKNEMSFQFQTTNYPEDLTIGEILNLFELETNIDKRKKIIKEKLETINLWEHQKKNTKELSGGQMQKFNLLLTMATEPKIIFFDEILSGLDQPSIDEVFIFIKKYIFNKITTVTISHNPSEIFNLCERVIFLHEGLIVANKKIDEYKNIENLEEDMKKYITLNNLIDYEKLMINKNKFILSDKIIECKNIKKTYGINDVLIGEDNLGINLDLKKGEKIALIGKNGSGKSTLVEIISKVKKPNKGGLIKINIEDWNNQNAKKREKLISLFEKEKKLKIKDKINKIEKKIKTKKIKTGVAIGIQFQKQFYPKTLNLRDVIIYNLNANKINYNDNYIIEILKAANLEKHINNSTFEISGGQRQKLNVLLTIIKQPPILILDELTTGLDLISKEQMINLINRYLKETESSLIMVTHSPEDLIKLSDKIILLKDGKIEKTISSKNINEYKAQKILRQL